MKRWHQAWLDVWNSVEILTVIMIPVLFGIKGLIDVNLNGQYDFMNYLLLFGGSVLGAFVFFGLLECIDQFSSFWHNRY
ncbi:hypothetical protein [Lactiplantibacillus daowaiensis]|uniref:Uncharacterized protein n=1 Tax=Lactiplantibacillus daowaiensis TaxID=2559918 RepID=A0ABW1S453_9LACO|nr:hypothetical protein [Lactiplantibacillus daowaiensis]